MAKEYRISQPELVYERMPDPQTTDTKLAKGGLIAVLNLRAGTEPVSWHDISDRMIEDTGTDIDHLRKATQVVIRVSGLIDQYPWLQGVSPFRLNQEVALTTRNFDIWAGNHLFDDYPGLFGISQIESHTLRGAMHGYQNLEELRRLADEAGIAFDHEQLSS